MKKLLFICTALLAVFFSNAAPKKKWAVCTYLPSGGLVSCWIEYGDNNPCDEFDFWILDSKGNPVQLTCNAGQCAPGTGQPHDFTNADFSFGPTEEGVLGLTCTNGTTITNYYDASSIVGNWQPLALTVVKDPNSDNITVTFFRRTNTEPFMQAPDIHTYTTTVTNLTNACNGNAPGMRVLGNGSKIMRTFKIHVSLYPNPATDKMSVRITSSAARVDGLTMKLVAVATGQEVLKRAVAVGETEVSIKDLAPGYYEVQVFNGERLVESLRVLKK